MPPLANAEQVTRHDNRIDEAAHRTLADLRPANCYFGDLHLEHARQAQDLNVKRETIDAHQVKEQSSDRSTVRLKATLRVAIRQPRKGLDHAVERPTHKSAMHSVSNDDRLVVRARTDRDISRADRLDEPREIGKLNGHISVHKCGDWRRCSSDSEPHRRALSAVFMQPENPEVRERGREQLLGAQSRLVRTAVVNDDQLCRSGTKHPAQNGFLKFASAFRKSARLVERWDNEG
jgi:hypothetical protein